MLTGRKNAKTIGTRLPPPILSVFKKQLPPTIGLPPRELGINSHKPPQAAPY